MFPYLLLALVVTAISAILDGIVTRRMMLLMDYALSGDMQILKQKAPELLILAAFMVPLGILVARANNYYKRKANISLKKYYIKKVFAKNIAEFQKENNAKYLSAMTNDFETLENNLISGIYSVCSGVVSFLVGKVRPSTYKLRHTGILFA